MEIALYAAVAENGVIGSDGDLPWRLSTDLKRFKAQTMGKPVVMGRKTWESFPRRPLPGRLNIVITRDPDYHAEGAAVVHGFEEALQAARDSGAGEAAVIGGGSIYELAAPLADRLHITHVLAKAGGDTFFPEIDPATWRIESSEEFPAGEKDDHPTRHVVYRRVKAV